MEGVIKFRGMMAHQSHSNFEFELEFEIEYVFEFETEFEDGFRKLKMV